MLKLKPLLSSINPKIYHNSIKLYSETTGKLETALSLTEPLTAQGIRAAFSTDCETPKDGSPEGCKMEESNEVVSKEVVGEQVASNVDYKRKKSKKCGFPNTMEPQDPDPPGGYIIDKCDVFDIPKTNSKKWRNLSYIVLPFVLGLSVLIAANKEEHSKPQFIPYEHLYIRTKRFAWRDGKTSLFHGPNNLIPEEEEKRLDREGATNPRYKTSIDEEADLERDEHALEELETREDQEEDTEIEQDQSQENP